MGSTRLNETYVPNGEACPAGQLELTEAAHLPPGADPRSNRYRCVCHPRILDMLPESYITSQVIVCSSQIDLGLAHEKTICVEGNDGNCYGRPLERECPSGGWPADQSSHSLFDDGRECRRY